MADLDSNNPITGNGTYDKTYQANPYLAIRLSGMTGGGDQVDIQELVGGTTYETILSFTADGGAKVQLSGNKLRFNVTNYSSAITWNCKPINQ